MTKLARDRSTHLTPREIAVEMLRQCDAGADAPSIRGLATALHVAPSAIYHHCASRGAIIEAALGLVWEETAQELVRVVPEPFTADPVEVLVASGVAMRRAFGRHYRIAPYAAATPTSSGLMATTLALLASVFERLGLRGEAAATAFHTYASMTLGAVLFAAMRRIANEQLERDADDAARSGERFRSTPGPQAARRSSDETRNALDDIMDLSAVDPERDEQLFEQGLRRLVASVAA